MDSSLRMFIRQFVGVVAAALALVILVAFWSIPLILGGHPGEKRTADPLAGNPQAFNPAELLLAAGTGCHLHLVYQAHAVQSPPHSCARLRRGRPGMHR